MTYIMVILSVPLSFPMTYMGVVIGGVKGFNFESSFEELRPV